MTAYGGRHKTRAAYRLADGRVKTSGTRLEVSLDSILAMLGYESRKNVKVHIPQDWTAYDHSIDLYPDSVVSIFGNSGVDLFPVRVKAILSDGHHYHDRTLSQERSDARKDKWYNRAGYHVVHVGEYWLMTKQQREKLPPYLDAAIKSDEWVVDLAC